MRRGALPPAAGGVTQSAAGARRDGQLRGNGAFPPPPSLQASPGLRCRDRVPAGLGHRSGEGAPGCVGDRGSLPHRQLLRRLRPGPPPRPPRRKPSPCRRAGTLPPASPSPSATGGWRGTAAPRPARLPETGALRREAPPLARPPPHTIRCWARSGHSRQGQRPARSRLSQRRRD